MFHIFERLEDRPQFGRAQRPVKILGEALEVDVRGVHRAEELLAGFRRDIAGGHRHRLETGIAAGVRDIDRIFEKDHGVVVSEGDRARAHRLRGSRNFRRRGLVLKAIELGRLRDVPVLAELAGEIAAGGAEGQHRRAGQKVIERLLLDGIDAKTRRPSVGGQDDLIAFAGAHETQPALAFAQLAKARADITLNATVLEFVPIAGAGCGRRGWFNGFCRVHDV